MLINNIYLIFIFKPCERKLKNNQPSTNFEAQEDRSLKNQQCQERISTCWNFPSNNYLQNISKIIKMKERK